MDDVRSIAPATKIVDVRGIRCGGDDLFLISGPCVIENEKQTLETAEKIQNIARSLGVSAIFKSSFLKDNRSSLNYYGGPGMEEGLRLLRKVRDETGLPVLTDIHYPDQVAPTAEVVDVIQIPAYLCMQSRLIVEAAKSGKPINIKHGQFLAPGNMAGPARKAESVGNSQIILTERGYTFGYNDLVFDPRSLHEFRQIGYPVVFDVTHTIRKYGIPSADPKGGARQYLNILARAAVASGIDGLFVEAHPDPQNALCDAASQLDIACLEEFVRPLLDLHATEVALRRS